MTKKELNVFSLGSQKNIYNDVISLVCCYFFRTEIIHKWLDKNVALITSSNDRFYNVLTLSRF